ncbi:MAG: Outer membrane protein assembly factor BamA [Verrucomicrobiae bacterium]|nr:Outer membrane protein assembly factor BamA [Verrucomicrobiae bacterium]
MIRWLGALLTLILLTAPAGAADEVGPVINEIVLQFVGPETVNRAIVRANIQSLVGKPRVRKTVEEDVRNLIATGFFFDVRVLEEPAGDGLKLIYQLTGKATLKEIVIEGAKGLKPDRLKREVKLKVGDVFDERKAHEDVVRMRELYEKSGFPDAKIESLSNIDRDTGKAILRYQVNEGGRIFIQKILITGNSAVKTGLLLKIIKTKRRWWGSFLAGSGVLKDEQFRDDLDKIRDHYRTKGYIDMEIKDVRIERVGSQWLVIHLDLVEGQQYKIGTVKIEGAKLFPTLTLNERLKLVAGQTFTPDGFSKDIKALEDYYGSRGYLDTRVLAAKQANVETGNLDLTYTVREGELAYLEKVIIRGNTKTKDKVIRRELAVAPGDIYNTVRVEASKERLKNLGYFSKVEMTPEPTPIPNRRDLAIQVEEQRTGNVTFGAGFSSVDNLIGFVEITQGNFDLFNWPSLTGAGQKMRVRAQLGLERQDYTMSFVEPWFLDQRLSLGVDVFHTLSSYYSNDFEEQRTGAALRFERALSEFFRASVEYRIQNIDLSVDNSASQELQSQEDDNLRSSIAFTLTHDSRDSVFLTTRGNRTELTAEIAGGPLGGDVSIYKLNAKTSFYFPFFDKHVLQIVGAAGVVDAFGQSSGAGPIVDEDPTPFVYPVKVNDVPIYDRFFLGGANTLRGFSYRKVGPKDINNEPVGGNSMVNGTAEYSFPIIEKIRGAFFVDAGEVLRDSFTFNTEDIKVDAGIGVRLNLPIGPLRLDYGYPLISDKQTGRTGKIQFSVGYQF